MRALLSMFAGILMSCQSPASDDMASVKKSVREEFPDVRQISIEELARRLETDETVVLLDVREEAEYAVSHLPGAIRMDPATKTAELLDGLDRETPIVAYCSVGYRSSQLAERLAAQGFTDVVNLEGSIFEWANEGLPLERDGLRVHEVHPFDEKWGRLLHEELRAYEPRTKPE